MKRIYTIGISLLLLGNLAKADTTFVAGTVSGSWTSEGSPYIVQGDLTVEGGETLSIGPGVRVYFDGPFFLQMDSASVLRAVGAEGDSVVFSGRTDVDSLRWAGINCEYSADTLCFEYCIIENATGQESRAALEILWSDAVIEHCSFRRNAGRAGRDVHGGALKLRDRTSQHNSVAIRNCAFNDNVGNHGGAVALEHATGEMVQCIFRNNHASSGGAIYGFGPPMEISDCEFHDNTTDSSSFARGGAIWYEGNYGLVRNCIFRNNYARGIGGAIADTWGGTYEDPASYENNVFENNRTDSLGGAMILDGYGTVKKCVFNSNQSADGGALYYYVSVEPLVVTQCTFVANVATTQSAAIGMSGTPSYSLKLVNSIIAYHTDVPAILKPDCGANHFRNNLFWENTGGTFEIDGCSNDLEDILYLDPYFMDYLNGNFALADSSPCIDAGIAGAMFHTTNDPDSTLPDIGAFYFHQTPNASDEPIEIVSEFSLSQNFPNPFNGETMIEFVVPMQTHATLELFDITGRQVRTLFDDVTQGRSSIHVSMNGLASGIYVYRLRTPQQQLSKKMLLIR